MTDRRMLPDIVAAVLAMAGVLVPLGILVVMIVLSFVATDPAPAPEVIYGVTLPEGNFHCYPAADS